MQTFVINLQERCDRLEHIIKQMEKENIYWTWIEGVDKNLINRKDYDIDCYRSISKGSIGCYLSHYKCYEKATEDLLLVFEDDVILEESFNELLKEAIDKVPKDFDVLFLGGTASYWKRHCHTYGKIKRVENNYFKVNGDFYGAEGYVITARARKIMIENKFPIRYPGGDIPLCRNGLNVYCLKDKICRQARMGSDIN